MLRAKSWRRLSLASGKVEAHKLKPTNRRRFASGCSPKPTGCKNGFKKVPKGLLRLKKIGVLLSQVVLLSHVFLMSFSCLSHVFLMSFSCLSHVFNVLKISRLNLDSSSAALSQWEAQLWPVAQQDKNIQEYTRIRCTQNLLCILQKEQMVFF